MSMPQRSESLAMIVCPSCRARYRLPEESLRAGRNVKCAKCGNQWFATLEPSGNEDIVTIQPQPQPAIEDAINEMDDAIVNHSDQQPETAEQEITPPEAPAFNIDDKNVVDVVPTTPEASKVAIMKASLKSMGRSSVGKIRPSQKRRPPSANKVYNLVALSCFAALLGLYQFRGQVVQFAPETNHIFEALGAGVNNRNIDIQEVKVESLTEQNKRFIEISGLLVNLAPIKQDVPRLRYAALGPTGEELINWTGAATQQTMNPRAGVTFQTRLAQPPEGTRSITVRFLSKRDLIAGTPQ